MENIVKLLVSSQNLIAKAGKCRLIQSERLKKFPEHKLISKNQKS